MLCLALQAGSAVVYSEVAAGVWVADGDLLARSISLLPADQSGAAEECIA